MSGPDRSVEAFYDLYPYPLVTSPSVPRPAGFKRGALDVLLRRREGERIPRDARIWVAGCGTQQAVHWALAFPEGRVLGTDLAGAPLAQSKVLAEQLGVTNLEVAQHDLMEPLDPARGPFDLIVSTGVIHHLPDPPRGMAHLRTAMKDDGALVFMVYSTMLRGPVRTFRQALAPLLRDEDDEATRYALAIALLERVLDSPSCAPPGAGALAILRERAASDRAFVADCLLHPLEQTYDLAGYQELVGDAGFRVTSWLHPEQWDLADRLATGADGEAHALLDTRVAGLRPDARAESVYHAAGHGGPLLEAVLEAKDAPQREPFLMIDFMQMPLACSPGRIVWKVADGQVTAKGETASLVAEGEVLRIVGSGPFGAPRSLSVPAAVEPLLRCFDGTRQAHEAAEPFVDSFGAGPIADLVMRMSPLGAGLLAPIW